MKKFKLTLLNFFALFISSCCLVAGESKITKANNIDIWVETFGQKNDPVLLLVMGAGGQGILWPTEFCERLVQRGFYVIRYDNRDTGQSSNFDFESNPYDLMDMAKDAIGLLDALEIKKAHIVGVSMGGPIAELMSVHYPSYIQSMTLIATSCDFRPINLAFAGLPPEQNALPGPKESYVAWMKDFQQNVPKNEKEDWEQKLRGWRIINGSILPFEEELHLNLQKQAVSRQKNPESIKNHLFVLKNSEHLIKSIPAQVRVPTLVLHGTEDPIFPIEHGEALAKLISGSKYVPIYGFGHALHSQLYGLMIQEIVGLANSASNIE